MTKKRKVALYVALMICLLFLALGISTLMLGRLPISFGGNSDRTHVVYESYRVQVPEGETAWIQVDLPISYGYQRVSEIAIEGAADWNIREDEGYQQALLTIEGQNDEQLISLQYTVTLLGLSETWSGEVLDEYLLPGEFIDSDNSSILEAAEPLIVSGNEYETARNIHRYVTKTLSPGGGGVNLERMSASEVLTARKGVCGDYACLMTALLRAADIPARDVGGIAMKSLRKPADWSHPGDSHAWVEFYVDGAWHFADPTWGNATFDNPDPWHLSYGMAITDIRSQEFSDLEKMIADQGYYPFGGMVAPLHFYAWCTGEGAIIVPRAELL